jgi:acyl-coenzyme A synthetase/AMP-(fatty) acid ligase
MTYLGRIDQQIKVHGHRVEIGEIEAVLREITGVPAVVAVGWPITLSGAGGITAFVGDLDVDTEMIRTAIAARLPAYMVPREIHLLPRLPLNPNGKFDRKALIRLLEESS